MQNTLNPHLKILSQIAHLASIVLSSKSNILWSKSASGVADEALSVHILSGKILSAGFDLKICELKQQVIGSPYSTLLWKAAESCYKHFPQPDPCGNE